MTKFIQTGEDLYSMFDKTYDIIETVKKADGRILVRGFHLSNSS